MRITVSNRESVESWFESAQTLARNPDNWGSAKNELRQSLKEKNSIATTVSGNSPKASGEESKYNFKIIKPVVGGKDVVVEDRFVKIGILPVGGLTMIVTNKSTEVMEIDWQRVSFVDFAGPAHRVIHAGVKLIEKDKALPPPLMPPTANTTKTGVPVGFLS
jgi:hypothetical protein